MVDRLFVSVNTSQNTGSQKIICDFTNIKTLGYYNYEYYKKDQYTKMQLKVLVELWG
jgi:hypothetical protein